MLRAEPLRCNRPDDAGRADGDSGQWTGEKRRKHLGPSPPSDTSEVADACMSSPCPSDGPRGQEEPLHILFKAPWEEEEPDTMGPVSEEEFLGYKNILSERPTICLTYCKLKLELQRKVYERLLLYRIRAHKLSQGAPEDNLGDDTLRKELPAFLQQHMSLCHLEYDVFNYIRSLEVEEGYSVDWYFDSQYSRFEELNDYQRLVLGNALHDVRFEYRAWEEYHSKFTTYEMDKDYVKFFDKVSSKLKWLKSYVGYPRKSDEWLNMYYRGLGQVLKIASKSEFPHLTRALAYAAYAEHIWKLRYIYFLHEDVDRLFFEIWKRVTTEGQTIPVALKELLRLNLVPRHRGYMEYALKDGSFSDLVARYNSCVEGMPGDASEERAKGFIIDAVRKRHKPKKMLCDYMARKIEIAESIGLVK